MDERLQDEKLIKKRIPAEKRFHKVGSTEIDLGILCRDPRDAIDDLSEVIEKDWTESRYNEWDTKLHPFAEASDFVKKDRYALNGYPPLYTDPQDVCRDCMSGPCNLKEKKGVCGLEFDAYQAKINLRLVCKGARSHIMETRELLEEAIKQFGRDKEVSFGKRHQLLDYASTIGQITGKYAKTVGVLERVMGYVEAQLNKMELAGFSGKGDVMAFESMAFHVGSMLGVAQEASELLKISCFGLASGANHDMTELVKWPPVNILGGLGNVDKTKPIVTFIGDNFLPAWATVNYLKDNKLTEEVEICGVGSVGDDLARYYDKTRIITTAANAARAIRLAFSDVIVASMGCMNFDLLRLAKKGGAKLIWVSAQPVGLEWIKDFTDESIETLVEELKKTDAIWCRDIDKAAEVAVRTAKEFKKERKNWGDYLIGDEEAKKEAGKCKENCDLCFNTCPYGVAVGKALRQVKEKGLEALETAEKNCVLCEKCEGACPEKIKITDLMVKASSKWAYTENFKMRHGRGTIPYDEVARSAWTVSNSPGWVRVLSCGGSKQMTDDVAWLVNQLASQNAFVSICGCGGAEVARYFSKEDNKFLYEKYGNEYIPKNVLFQGACSTHCQATETGAHWSRIGPHISHYGNFIEVSDICARQMRTPTVLWGETPERMYSIAAAYARYGETVIVGPVRGFQWKRFMLGNQYDRSKWHIWDSATGREVETEPAHEHVIIPVETIEEALVMLWNVVHGASDISIYRILKLEQYLELHQKFFGELPDNWQWFVKTNQDLPIKWRAKLLKKLKDDFGWDTTYAMINKARHRDGRLLEPAQFSREYGHAEARFFAKNPELTSRKAKKNMSEEQKQKYRAEGYRL